jgi:RNA polymerase primary sigma factor
MTRERLLNMELDGGIKIYLREIGKTDLLTPDQEVELAERIKRGDPEARSHMIRANLRLVVKIAQDYANYGLPLLDLISEGNIGLMKAVERFDPNKGGKLSTYAAWWIKQSIKRALANQSKTIRLPVHMVDKISKMRRVAMAMSEELGREPTDDELSEEIGIDRAKLSQLKVASMRPASLDAPISDDDSTEFGEIVGDENAQTPFELLSHKNMHGQLDGLLTVLDERERKIIDARFGLAGQKPRTLEEVGQEFGVTRERIRQLQNIALRKLRRALQKKEDPIPKALRNAGGKKKKKLRLPKNFVRSDDGVKGAESRIVAVDRGLRHSCRDESLLHVRGFIVALGGIVSADDQGPNLSRMVELCRSLDPGVEKTVWAAACNEL